MDKPDYYDFLEKRSSERNIQEAGKNAENFETIVGR